MMVFIIAFILQMLDECLEFLETRSSSYEVHIQGVFFHWASPKKTKSKIMLEYPDWASPGPPQKVKVHGLGLP